MAHKRHRLRQRRIIDAIRKSGVAYHHPLAVLLVQPNDSSISRYGLSASKRVGTAVVRNQAKRRFREVMRHCLPKLQPGWDIFFVLRKPAAATNYADISAAVHNLLDRAQLWRSDDMEIA